MEWHDEGTLISLRPHGESSAIVDIFTAEHGRHSGVVRGGNSRRMAPFLQPGSQVSVTWRARLEDHLGSFVVEPMKSRAGLMADRLGLAGLNAICAMLRVSLPERLSQPLLYRTTQSLLAALENDPAWPAAYLRWELHLLEELGFGLDLQSCAVTGQREDLAFVSPKTGRAVSREGAGDWANRLLPLPLCLMGQGPATHAELVAGLSVTGHFLQRELGPQLKGHLLPEARSRLLTLLTREPTAGPA